MRTIIEIPQEQLDSLSKICQSEKLSRAEAIRQAIAAFVKAYPFSNEVDEAFGIWRNKRQSGLVYQDNLRQEWS